MLSLQHAVSFNVCLDNSLIARACPLEMIDQIGGWSSIGTTGTKYGQGYDLDAVREQMSKISTIDKL